MTEENVQLKKIIEGAILAAGEALSIQKIQSLFVDEGVPEKETILEVVQQISESCEGRGFSLIEVASGWRFKVNEELSQWVNRLWDEKPQKYSRALLETLSLVAYRQPLTRGDIEEVRGVAVSSHIIKTLTERDWVKVVGHRDVPGRPALYATTRAFLDYFNLKSLDELPILSDLKDIESLNQALEFEGDSAAEGKAGEGEAVSSKPAGDVENVDSEPVGSAESVNDSPVGDEVSLKGDSDSSSDTEGAETDATESSDDNDDALENIDTSLENVDDSLNVDDSSKEEIDDSLEQADASLAEIDEPSSDIDKSVEKESSPSETKDNVAGSVLGEESVESLFDESEPDVGDFGLGEQNLDSASPSAIAEDSDIAEDELNTPAEAPKPSYASLFQDSVPPEPESSSVDESGVAPTENNGLDPEGEEQLEKPECDESSGSNSDNKTHDETDNFEQTAQPDEAPVND